MTAPERPDTRVLNAESLRELIMAGARRVIVHREHLDRINVFPVPDKDTGTNLAMTMRAILDGLRQPPPSLAAVSSTVATSALTGAQGNASVVFAQFFQGLRLLRLQKSQPRGRRASMSTTDAHTTEEDASSHAIASRRFLLDSESSSS